MKNKLVAINEYGFYTLVNKPSTQELEEYYASSYYQNGVVYQHNYSDEEVKFINNKIEQKYFKIIQLGLLKESQAYSFLDVGCGEGFTLKYFKNLGWDIKGLDFSDHGCKSINPNLAHYLTKGDIYENIAKLISEGKKYDLIWLDNVLEHVLDPLDLLEKLGQLSASNGVLAIDVPNDFSVVQNNLLENNFIKENFWVVVPDHLSYFNSEGLKNICKKANWSCSSIMTDFPIDWFLFNEHSNYKMNSTLGKQAHKARVTIENLLHSISIEKTNSLYEKMGELGIGRTLIGIFTTNKS